MLQQSITPYLQDGESGTYMDVPSGESTQI